MGGAYLFFLGVSYFVVILFIIFPLFALARTSWLLAVVVILFVFLFVPPLIALGIQFLITRALEWGRTMFSRGKINIAVQKTNYAPGDTISGTVALTLRKPVEAKGVSILLNAEEITWGGGGVLELILSRGNLTVSRERKRIYDHKQLLDGEKEYSERREYHFEMKIPDAPATEPRKPSRTGKLGEAQEASRIAAAITGLTPYQEASEPEGNQNRWLEIAKTAAAGAGLIRIQRTNWYLLARLDIPHGLDIRRKVNIAVG